MKRVLISTLTAALLCSVGVAKETPAKDATAQQVKTIAVNNAREEARAQQAELVQEAIDSLKYAHEALVALDKKDTKKAKERIEKALGKLEAILASKKVPELLPIDNVIRVSEFLGTSEDAKKAIKIVEELLEEGKIQEARLALMPLQSQIDITVVNLPLGTYPDALKLSAKHIADGKNEAAKAVLATALSTFVEVTHILPLPILKAQDLVSAAEAIAKKDKQLALSYLASAKEQLEVAEVLGYVSESDVTYKMLHEGIEGIEKEIKGPNKAEKLFEALKEKLKTFKEKIVQPKNAEQSK